MLVLTRKLDEAIVLDGKIKVTVVQVRGNQVRLGIDCEKDVTIDRYEVWEEIQRLGFDRRRENAAAKKRTRA